MSRIVLGTDGIEYQLQLLDGRDYRPDVTGEYSVVFAAFEQLAGVTRRLVRVDRAWPISNPKLRRSRYEGYSRSKETVREEYLTWCRAHGVTSITAFSGTSFTKVSGIGRKQYANLAASFTVQYVDPETYFAVTEETADESSVALLRRQAA